MLEVRWERRKALGKIWKESRGSCTEMNCGRNMWVYGL